MTSFISRLCLAFFIFPFFAFHARGVDYNSTLTAGGGYPWADGTFSFFTKKDGSLWAMGENGFGQLGDGTTINQNTPVKVDENVTMVDAGREYCYYIKSDGSLLAADSSELIQIEKSDVVSVSAGWGHITYIKSDGTLWAQVRSILVPSPNGPILIDQNVSKMSAGSYHTLYIKDDGSLWAMGSNWYGELGDGTKTQRNSPIKIDENVSQVSAGYDHSLFVKEDSSLWAMGRNTSGQLGDGTTTDRSTPIQVDQNVSSVSAGFQHSLFVKKNGGLWAMGMNSEGQLGDGTIKNGSTALLIDQNVSKAVAGSFHSLYMKNDMSLWAMGDNTSGQLGDGTNTDRNASVEVVSANAMQPQTLAVTVVANSSNGAVTATGDFNSTALVGTYDKNTAVNLTASLSSLGYIFSGWSGDLSGTNLTPTLTMSDHRAVTATFAQDTGDTDSDGLTNYAELVTHATDPNDSDSDDDTLTDGEEIQISLDPNTANTALVTFFDGREAIARTDGNTSGISYVQANLNQYSLYTEVEKNASDVTQYASGVSDGNTSGIAYVQANLNQYSLYTEVEKNASDATQYASGVIDGNTSGISYVQSNLSQYSLYTETEKKISVEEAKNLAKPYTSGWYFQPGLGWLWTNLTIFPSVYLVENGQETGRWLTIDLFDQSRGFLLDESNQSWVSFSDLSLVSNPFYYTEMEKNASDAAQYARGVSDGNTSGIAYVQANLSTYSLYTEMEKNASDASQYENGKAVGNAEGLATVQADLASQGLSLLTYLNQMKVGTPHTHNWYFQPEWGWMWTSPEQFPYIYLAGDGESPGTWLYFGQIPGQEAASFYDYSAKRWRSPSD